MKADAKTDRMSIERFEQIVNVGPAVARDLRLLGFDKPRELIGQDPAELYVRLCKLTSVRQDPCVLDVFMAIVDFMNGNAPRAWWKYTEDRKAKYEDIYSQDS